MYDFRPLSSLEFETLVRDLLQEHLSIWLESFKPGRDSGIDFRSISSEGEETIVQCKHYVGSGLSKLLRAVYLEVSNVKKLEPHRYILATSVGLSPENKNTLLDLLKPYCQMPNDIYGASDLNNLLGMYPEIERRHFKLWLTSSQVLTDLLNGDLYTLSKLVAERISKKARLYVQNVSFLEALTILKSHGYCIISGIPGIGKTFLAEILLLYYMSKDFKPFVLRSDVSEAFRVLNPHEKQVFLYDDFLGQTGFEERLGKNEEMGLLELIEHVRRNKQSKLILTTREYILQQAKSCYEKLNSAHLESSTCIIELRSYSRRDKARILFNHLYFSDLPRECVDALREGRSSLRIVDHRNYSPRIVEWMTELHRLAGLSCSNYPKAFLSTLSAPHELWSHAYHRHISELSRSLLSVLTTMGSAVLLEDLECAVESFFNRDSAREPIRIDARSLRGSLEELEGSFLAYERDDYSVFVGFNNPSIRDFLNDLIKIDEKLLKALTGGAVFYEQLLQLCRVLGQDLTEAQRRLTSLVGPESMAKLLVDTSQRAVVERLMQRKQDGSIAIYMVQKSAIENNIVHALKWCTLLPSGVRVVAAGNLLSAADERLNSGKAELLAVLAILDTANDICLECESRAALFRSVASHVELLSYDCETVDDIKAVYRFDSMFPGTLSSSCVSAIKQFLADRGEEVFDWEAESLAEECQFDELLQFVENIGEHFCIDLELVVESLHRYRDSGIGFVGDVEYDKVGEVVGDRSDASDEEIIRMFDKL